MDHRPPPHRNSTPPLCRSLSRPPPHRNNTPPHHNDTPPRNNAPWSTRDPRSVFDSEQSRNPFPPLPHHSTEERFNELQRSQIAMINMMQDLQATMTSLAGKLDRMIVNSPFPRSEVLHQEHVLHRQLNPEASMQQPGNSNLSGFAANMMSNGIFQEFCSRFGINPLILSNSKQLEPVAAQVFEETPQPSVKAAGDENEGKKSQKSETPQAYNPSKDLEIHHVQKINEFGIDFLKNEVKLELNLCAKEAGDCAIVFPVIDKEESSYFVESNCNLVIHSGLLDAHAHCPQIRMKGTEKEKIGVG